MFFTNKKIIFVKDDLYESNYDNCYYFDLKIRNIPIGYKIKVGEKYIVDKMLESENCIEIDNKFKLDKDTILIPSKDGNCFIEFYGLVNWKISPKIYEGYNCLVEVIFARHQIAERIAVYQRIK